MTQFKRKKSRFPADTPIWVLQVALVGCLLVWVGLLFAPFGSHDAALDRNAEQQTAVLSKSSLLRNQFAEKKPVVVQAPPPAQKAAKSEGDDSTGEAETDDSEPKNADAASKEEDDDKAEGVEGNEEIEVEEEDADNGEDEEDADNGEDEDADNEADEDADNEDAAEGGDADGSAEEDGEDADEAEGGDANEAEGGDAIGADGEEADGEDEEDKKVERRRLDDGQEELDSKRYIMDISGLMGDNTSGRVVIETRPAWAPRGAGHFHMLIENGFYNQCRFFRVVPNFIVQFGIAADPQVEKMWRNGVLLDDPVKKSNERGTITYATAGPNTRTTQLFFNTVSNSFLDRQGFAPFAEVVEGMHFIDKINNEYGESPDQERIEERGNEYLNSHFPNLSYIVEIHEDQGY